MRITKHTNYAIRMLMYCHSKNAAASISEISSFYGVSKKFLTKILLDLTKAGLIVTFRGRNGGMLLAKPAEEILIGDTVKKIEGKFDLAECFQTGKTNCPLIDNCGLNEAFSLALYSFFDVLNRYSVASITTDKYLINSLLKLDLVEDRALPRD